MGENDAMAEGFFIYPIRGEKLQTRVQVEKTLCSFQSGFQNIEIIETAAFGKMLLLDGHVQLAELDEHAYHEALVHLPLMNMNQPKSALVVGGGDGGVLRELCRWDSIEHIDMVEIDEAVIRLCREHLPSLNNGAFDDPRVHLTIGDAFPFVKEATRQYDLIVADATDVYEGEEGNLSEALFTEEFYRDLARLLSPQGVVVTQADNLLFCPYSLDGIFESFKPVFANVGSYWAMVPSFGGFSGYAWGGVTGCVDLKWNDNLPKGLKHLTPEVVALASKPLPF